MVKNELKISVDSLVDNQKIFCSSLDKISKLEENLGCIDGKIIGTGRADYTQGSTEYKLLVNNNEFLLIDIPGIEGNEVKYKPIIEDSLAKAHLIFYVNGSGKKAEKDTLDKIKNYMRDGTAVYALFNVHCKAKENPVKGIDKPFEEELAEAYKMQNEITIQTEKELKSFLGENFKDSVALNGLLSFSSVAMDSYGKSTVVDDKDKGLRKTQTIFMREYSDDLKKMQKDSNISAVEDIIVQKIDHFDEYIYEENIKKLKNRLSYVCSEISNLKTEDAEKIRKFLEKYSAFERDCKTAKEYFFQSIRQIGRNEIEPAFCAVRDALFSEIEQCGRKLEEYRVKSIFNQHKEDIIKAIESAVNNKINDAINEYQESVLEARKRLLYDLEREQKKFEIEMKSKELSLNISFLKELKFTGKDFWKGIKKIGAYTISGVQLGNGVGGVVVSLVGVVGWIRGLLPSRATKINRAKEKLQETLSEQIDKLTDELKRKIKTIGIEEKINQNHREIKAGIEKQRKSLNNIKQLLDVVVTSLNNRFEEIDK